MMHATPKQADRKIKKRYDLSPESVEFRHEQEKATLEKAVVDYYNSLSDAEVEEQTNWGQFALSEFLTPVPNPADELIGPVPEPS